MKSLFVLVLFLFVQKAFTQGNAVASASEFTSGSVFFPALQSIKVEPLYNEPIHFSQPSEYSQGKVVSGFCRITVISNVPWTVSVQSSSAYLYSSQDSSPDNVPAGIFELRGGINGQFVPLSKTDIPLLVSHNNKTLNIYDLDLKANPSWNYGGGTYNMNIIFTLTPQ
jgi:hypothetical protein